MTRIFINGVEVGQEDLENIEIDCEVLNQILMIKTTKDKNRGDVG